MRDLQQYVITCKSELDALNIPYSKNIVVQDADINAWGRCRRFRDGTYLIQINSVLLSDDTNGDAGLKDTIIHELLHTVYGCMRHNTLWKHYANIVNIRYGYNISRVATCDDTGVSNDYLRNKSKYILCCDKCHTEFYRQRLCPVVQNTWRYRCHCGGTIQRIK